MLIYQTNLTDQTLATMNQGFVKSLVTNGFTPIVVSHSFFFVKLSNEIPGCPGHPGNFNLQALDNLPPPDNLHI
jgi:hypothetical protein